MTPAMDPVLLDAAVIGASDLIGWLTLCDEASVEIAGLTRQPVTWALLAAGLVRPLTDTTFEIPPNAVVACWAGTAAETGGDLLVITPLGRDPVSGKWQVEQYGPAGGTFTVTAALTGISVLGPDS